MRISLKAARVNAGLSQEEVAQKVQVSRDTVLNWEKGKTDISKKKFDELCSLYGAEADDIFLPFDSTFGRKQYEGVKNEIPHRWNNDNARASDANQGIHRRG